MASFSFVALDIGTATGKRSSICEIKESKSWLIKPDGYLLAELI